MSNGRSAITFTLGAGGGLLLWYLRRASHSTGSPPSPPARGATTDTASAGACVLRLDTNGITADGAHVGIADVVARCKAAGRADVTIVAGVPAALYRDVMSALVHAGVPTTAHRNARPRPRAARGERRANEPSPNAERSQTFTLITYTQGFKSAPRLRWFVAETPVTWVDAYDRLASAGLDLALAGRTREPGGWLLSTEPRHFRPDRAEPMPGGTDG
ncbi:MAG: hypothetical protein ACTHU0_10365 [Kofleriaceae bacterium]